MKKILFLTVLFTSLFIGLTACSESEDIIDSTDDPQWFPTYTLVGKLTYNSDSTGYLLEIAKESDKLVNDTLIPMWGEKPTERITVLKAKTGWTVLLDGTEISSMVGSTVSIPVGNHSIRKEEGEDEFVLHFLYNISVVSDSRSSDGYIIDSNPPIYPDAYTTVPLSRAAFNLSGHYELVNVYVHVIRTTNGIGKNKEDISTQIMNHLKRIYPESSTHIRFQLLGSDYIDYLTDNMIKNLDLSNDTEKTKIFNMRYHSDALDIYYLSSWEKTYNGGYLLGVANGIPSTSFILSPQFTVWDKNTPAHEAGHCFGLFHTHHGTAAGEGGIPEYVDGSNSTTAGDLIADTPADPNAWIGGKYDSSRGLRDGHGQSYTPDPHNVMSYSHISDQELTPLQIERIHNFLSNNSTVSAMATRPISADGTQFSGTGTFHFSEKTKTLTFPTVASDEVVTWTIYQRSGYNSSTSLANATVTTKTGASITLTHNNPADYYEVSAATTTPYGVERKSVWKATAGVPSAAVGGTLSWTGGDGTSGSFPGYSPTLTLNNYDTSLDLKYTDLANPTYRSGITYRLYTSAGGMMESTWGDFNISEMDCSRGYVEVQAVDNCCGEGMRWRIECQSRWDIFSLDVKDGQLMIDVKPATAQAATAEKASAKRNLSIKSIKLTTPEGRELVGRTLDTPQRKMSLSTVGMAKGQYQIEITDVDGNVHKGHFGI